MRTALAPLLLALGLALQPGCAHRVRVSSQPPGAEVRFRGRLVGTTPCEFTTLWAPLRRMNVQLRLPGQRTTTLHLNDDTGPLRMIGDILRPWRWARLVGRQVRTEHDVVLVRRHGRAGTWTPEDALEGR